MNTTAFALGLLVLMASLVPSPLHGDLVGVELFTYPDGPIDGQAGGAGFDFDARLDNGPFTGSTGTSSDWDAIWAGATISSGTMKTQGTGALREFNGTGEGPASDEQLGLFESTNALSTVYITFELTRDAGATWGGMAVADLGTDTLFFGVPGAASPVSGVLEFGIETAGGGGTPMYTGRAPIVGETVTLVVKIDTVAEIATLFLDPDLSQPEVSNTPSATHAWPAGFGASAILFVSGGSGDCTWDNLAVATSWESVENALSPPIPEDETIPAHPGSPVRVQVTENDFGFADPASLVITQQPALGSAIADTSGFISYTPPTGSSPASETVHYKVSNQIGQSTTEGVLTIQSTSDLRVPLLASRMPDQSAPTSIQLANALPGLSFSFPVDADFLPNATQQLVVSERGGRLMVVPNINAGSPSATVFLDLAAELLSRGNEEIATGGENGLKSVAIHPDYGTNGKVYLGYSLLVGGSDERARISCFTRSTTNPDVLDPSSEEILIDLDQIDWSHGIDCLAFGPDGYLYISIGDGGPRPSNENPSNPQFITKGLWSGMSRIDVDKNPGSLAPNPHPAIILDGGGNAGFGIPPDNPYIHTSLGGTWDGTFNGSSYATSLTQVRTEFYAVGLRNPWRFTFDSLTGEIWCGDVGQDAIEEVNIVVAGGNYGWPYFEGLSPWDVTPPPGWTGNDPEYTYQHGSGDFNGMSVTGGVLYRGSAYPQWEGKYIFGDFQRGHIWLLEPGGAIERITGMVSPVSFTMDPNTDEILIVSFSGTINRLQETQQQFNFPETLSDTGLFADLTNLTPNPGLNPYEAVLPFWSDNAIKKRFFGIPSATDTINFAEEGPWGYPEGMIWVKHFDMELTPGVPASRTRLETRVMVRDTGGVYGVSYRWNGAQTEANLVDEAGESFDLTINDPGGPRIQTWAIPSRSDCLICHTENAGNALSFVTRQLNMPGSLGPASGNFIDLLASAGYLDTSPPTGADLPRHLQPDDDAYSLTERVRSYLDVNCGYCHNPIGTAAPAAWDGRTSIPLSATGIMEGVIQGGANHIDDRLIVPGNVPRSVILSRIAETNGYGRMPPLASSEHDTAAIQLLTDWIQQEAAVPQTYQEWRLAEFLSSSSPEGEPGADPDKDGKTNEFEWLTKTDPQDATDCWSLEIGSTPAGMEVFYQGLADRSVRILQSGDLENWSPWDHPDNDGLPRNPALPAVLSITPGMGQQYFRAEVQER